MTAKITFQECILVVITQGFDEAGTVTLISTLRQAGLCVKSLAMTNGLIDGTYGICVMPDLTLSDLDNLSKTTVVRAVILPESEQCLARLEVDPRLHYFLRKVLSLGGNIVVNAAGRRFLRKTSVGDPSLLESNSGGEPLLLSWDQGQPVDELVHSFLHKVGQPSHAKW